MKKRPKALSKDTLAIFDEAAAVVFFHGRSWWVRQYHSNYAMNAHLRHLAKGTPPPKHWNKPKGWNWASAYSDEGPFTKKEAGEFALELCAWANRGEESRVMEIDASKWLLPCKLVDHVVDYYGGNWKAIEKKVYALVINSEIRALTRDRRPLTSLQLRLIAAKKWAPDSDFGLPGDIGLSVEDAERIFGAPPKTVEH
jgi:hypothetical protein